MKSLEKLIIDAQIITQPEAEVERVMQVCNACRYCEGFCAVFPAMTQRLAFGKADINYLANLCHNCGACLHACQYAPPHEFAINVPKAMAEVRLETYQHYAQPAAFGSLYRRAGMTTVLALVGGLIVFLLLAMGLKGSLRHPPLAGDEVFDHRALALPPIRNHIDRIALEQQLDILAHLIRPLRLEWQSVTERTDRLEAEAPDFRFRGLKLGDHLVDGQSGDLPADVDFLDIHRSIFDYAAVMQQSFIAAIPGRLRAELLERPPFGKPELLVLDFRLRVVVLADDHEPRLQHLVLRV